MATVCKYGQLHVERYAEMPAFEAQAREAELKRVSECRRGSASAVVTAPTCAPGS